MRRRMQHAVAGPVRRADPDPALRRDRASRTGGGARPTRCPHRGRGRAGARARRGPHQLARRDFNERVGKLDKSKKHVIYCLSGVRSANATRRMGELGFTQRFDFAGGWSTYEKAGKPFVTGAALGATPGGSAEHSAAAGAHGDVKPTIHPAADTAWKDGPPSLPGGEKTAVLEGDPSKEGRSCSA